MTPAEADERIVLSRHTLHRYVALADSGYFLTSDSVLVADEIALLEDIAEEHPGKAAKLESLVPDWRAFQDRIKAKMH
jgi:hypothetical protein